MFLRSSSHNLRYVGIDALAGITGLNPAAAAEHQVAVLDCLEVGGGCGGRGTKGLGG